MPYFFMDIVHINYQGVKTHRLYAGEQENYILQREILDVTQLYFNIYHLEIY